MPPGRPSKRARHAQQLSEASENLVADVNSNRAPVKTLPAGELLQPGLSLHDTNAEEEHYIARVVSDALHPPTMSLDKEELYREHTEDGRCWNCSSGHYCVEVPEAVIWYAEEFLAEKALWEEDKLRGAAVVPW